MAFGMELGSKMILTWLRIIFSILFIYYLYKIRKRHDLPKGFVACIALITAGAIGNVIDCIAYGQLFNDPMPPQVAQFLPSEGGYASLFNGKVVDMLYFPIIDVARENASWLPDFFFGPDNHFIFFRPIFNFADAAITIGVFYMLLFQWKWLKSIK
jgi:signal peptidase II